MEFNDSVSLSRLATLGVVSSSNEAAWEHSVRRKNPKYPVRAYNSEVAPVTNFALKWSL